jgi:hypothetical protein
MNQYQQKDKTKFSLFFEGPINILKTFLFSSIWPLYCCHTGKWKIITKVLPTYYRNKEIKMETKSINKNNQHCINFHSQAHKIIACYASVQQYFVKY